jgi:hypothetical protein
MKEFKSVIINKCPCTNAFLYVDYSNIIKINFDNLFDNSLIILLMNLDTILASYLFYLDETV